MENLLAVRVDDPVVAEVLRDAEVPLPAAPQRQLPVGGAGILASVREARLRLVQRTLELRGLRRAARVNRRARLASGLSGVAGRFRTDWLLLSRFRLRSRRKPAPWLSRVTGRFRRFVLSRRGVASGLAGEARWSLRLVFGRATWLSWITARNRSGLLGLRGASWLSWIARGNGSGFLGLRGASRLPWVTGGNGSRSFWLGTARLSRVTGRYGLARSCRLI